MGHKKRNPIHLSKPPSSTPLSLASSVVASLADANAAADDLEQKSFQESVQLDAIVKLECERALNALRRGNHTKALRLMKESCHQYQNSAILHRVHGTIFVKIASLIEDSNAKQRHLSNAIESAKKAASLSPNSIEFAHFYANLLYEANDGKGYEEVLQECERGLSIENPIDPAKESLYDEQKMPTAEARISHVQQELRSLIQKSNIASISNWMKNLGNGNDNGNGEKIQLIPMRRIPEDPMNVGLMQTKRSNEIKKATKTLEERRKEIEVRVAAARLLQQRNDSSLPMSPQNYEEDRAPPSSPPGVHRLSERRKYANLRKVVSMVDRIDQVRPYWNSMSQDQKKSLFEVNVHDLKAYYSTSKDNSMIEALSEALSFAEANKTWKYWTCCCCIQKFPDSDSHIHHVVREHMGSMLPKLQAVMPQELDADWTRMIENGTWKPVDVCATLQMLEQQSNCQSRSIVDGLTDTSRVEDSTEVQYLDDTWESKADNNSNFDLTEHDGNHWDKTYSLARSWPLSDDSECTKLLEKIRGMFQVLLKHKYLASSHLNRVIHYAMEELQGLAPGSPILDIGLDQTPLCICFMGASQLKKILKCLQEIAHSSGLGRFPERNSISDEMLSGIAGFEIKERIILTGGFLYLLLDECLLQREFSPPSPSDKNTSVDDGTSASSVILGAQEYTGPPNSDLLLSWIFAGPSSGEQLASWTRLREEKTHRATEILRVLEKEFHFLQSLCERKCEHFSYEEALQAVEVICLEELKKREQIGEFVPQSYEMVLRKRQELLVEKDNDVLLRSSRFELDAISNVLKEAHTLEATQFGHEEAMECVGDEDWKMEAILHQTDSCVDVAIQRQRDNVSTEISKIDARLMRNITGMQQLENKLGICSAQDCRTIMLPYVKSFIRARLEELADKDATKKSEAAREAFLAELAIDAKKSVHKGGDHSKHMQERSKDKKKNKENRKFKDTKTNTANEQFLLDQETEEPAHSLAVSDGLLDSGVVGMSSGHDLREEEEFRRKIELEADERKLAETLEYQRRLENKARELAEQQKKGSGGTAGNVASGLLVADPLRHCQSVTYIGSVPCPVKWTGTLESTSRVLFSSDNQKIELDQPKRHIVHKPHEFYEDPWKSEGTVDISVNNAKGNALARKSSGGERIKSTHDHSDGKVQQVRSNQGTPENAVLPIVQQKGSQEKQQCNFTKSPGRMSQSLAFEKEIHEVGNLQNEGYSREQADARLIKAHPAGNETLQSFQNLPEGPRSTVSSKVYPEANDIGALKNEIMVKSMDGIKVFGTGLTNEIGEYNCFLNVIIQSLWHIRRFRDEFLGTTTLSHAHIGDPCVVCSLHKIFTALSMTTTETQREAVVPNCLRTALSNLYPDSNFFQEAQMNDASEVLAVMFDCLHISFTSNSGEVDANSKETNCRGSWDCVDTFCIAHKYFGMNIFEQMSCNSCGVGSRHLKYTSFFHNINASALRTMKSMSTESSFDELLKFVEINHQLPCDREVGGCGKLNHIHHILSTSPHVLTIVVGWQNSCETANDISETLAAIATELDIAVLYHGLDPGNQHHLVSVVCYYGRHYRCFAYSHDHESWIMYDDITVKVIGDWNDVLDMCKRGHLQPQVLFFEDVN